MATIIITSVDIFNDKDPERCMASISRKGGGRYVLKKFDGVVGDDFDNYEDALAAAIAYVEEAESGDFSEARYKDRLIADQQAQIKELQRLLSVPLTPEVSPVKPADVRGS